VIQVGVVLAEAGSAIVIAEHGRDGAVVTGIERLPFSLDAVAERVEPMAAAMPAPTVVVDAEGLGSALWRTLPRLRGQWRLYSERGLERQKLVDALAIAVHFDQLHFAAGLDNQEAMSKALVSYRRQVREDGLIGSELVIALCLAIVRRPRAQAFVA
jgi:hypothetical protein